VHRSEFKIATVRLKPDTTDGFQTGSTHPVVTLPVTVDPPRGVQDTVPAVRDAAGQGALDVEALSRQYGAMVLRRCRRLLGSEDDALDACQDVFVRVLEHRRRLEDRYPSSLLYRMATNVCLNRIRDRGRRPSPPGHPLDEVEREDLLASIASAEEPGAGSEARLILDWLFGRHPESSRTMAVLHYVDGLTLEEVARQTGLSVSGVRKRLHRLRQSLTEMER
jgi:RNA polymerase sigma-70 factor (ECF subfamily)